jgi:hypothetical protein
MFIPLGNSVHYFHYQVQVPPSFMGLVAADKNTVAVPSSEVMLTFAAFPVQIPGQVKKNFLLNWYLI